MRLPRPPTARAAAAAVAAAVRRRPVVGAWVSSSPSRHYHSNTVVAASNAADGAGSSSSGATPSTSGRPTVDAAARARAEAYLDAVLAANESMNLTAVRDRPAALLRHIDDSLDFLPFLDAAAANTPSSSFSIIDVGSGAGFPGVVLAAARPAFRVTLLDSLRKRMDFCQRAARGVGIDNVAAVWGRAEDAGRSAAAASSAKDAGRSAAAAATADTPPQLRASADAVVARAVAELRVLAELCLPLVKAGGVWVAAKGPEPDDEVGAAATAIAQLGGGPPTVHRLPPLGPGLPARSLVVVAKVAETPPQFPRRAGVPAKRPL